MDTPPAISPVDAPPRDARLSWRLAWLRLLLGFAQMGGAVLSATFLATLGVEHPLTVGAVLATTALTATSRALFHR